MTSFQHTVLFRYFFFHWLFRDASVKEFYQRSAAIAHNQANRHHLITYLRRWIALTLLMYFFGIMFEQFNMLACVFFYTRRTVRLHHCENYRDLDISGATKPATQFVISYLKLPAPRPRDPGDEHHAP